MSYIPPGRLGSWQSVWLGLFYNRMSGFLSRCLKFLITSPVMLLVLLWHWSRVVGPAWYRHQTHDRVLSLHCVFVSVDVPSHVHYLALSGVEAQLPLAHMSYPIVAVVLECFGFVILGEAIADHGLIPRKHTTTSRTAFTWTRKVLGPALHLWPLSIQT